jgi:hypothetical protein
MFELGFRSGHDQAAMMFAGGLMFALFAIARISGMAFPSVDGKASKAALVVSRICLIGLLISATWFCIVAYDYMTLLDMFKTR